MEKLIYLSVLVVSSFLFVSISLSAASHLFIIIPGIYFTFTKFKTIKISKSMWSLIAVILIGVISVLTNLKLLHSAPMWHIVKLKYFLLSLLSIWAFSYLAEQKIDPIKKEKYIKLLINVALISSAIATTSGLIALLSGFNPLKFKPACHISRNCGMYGMYMSYGYGMLYFLIPHTGLLLFQKKLQNRFPNLINSKLLVITWLINFIGFVLSFARGALIAFILSAPFFFFKNYKKKFLASITILILILSSLIFFTQKFRDNFFDEERIESVKIRLSMFETVLAVVKEHPLLGIGYKNFEPSSGEYKKRYNIAHPEFIGHAHNNFLEHLASTGILGFIALLLFHFFWLIEMYKREDIIAKLVFPLIIALFISGQSQYTLGDGENLFFIMLIYALSQIDFKNRDLIL